MNDGTATQPRTRRWLQLFAGVVCMVMIANLQYGWTLFVQPINQKYGWGLPAIQVAFSIFVICESWLVPFEGWFVDRFGPRLVVIAGGLLVTTGELPLLAELLERIPQSVLTLSRVPGVGPKKAAALFRELESGQTKISLRSNGGLDVQSIAKSQGGGGHRSAAGAVVSDSMESTIERMKPVLTALARS